ncbi:T7SS effector LXG polymorphic toxin [Peribacillus sp. NPDC097206]|uniref:T7SS effector LXG polymorphic toxin n=1 Tax=unclassified Peribacillus TaxID=2675266 RepID=UPI00382070C4
MTIFEAKPLKSAVKSRAKQYEDLKGQVETLKKELQGIVDLDEELAGAGATAIKNFYRAQVTVANAWIELFSTQISFLKGIPAILEEADLSGETVVEVPFLEGEVTQGLSNAKSMVNQQSTDLQKIFQNIDDILPLTVFKQEDFHEKMEKAEKEKNTTIKKVKDVDSKLVDEYEVSEGQEKVAIGLVQALIEATSQDGTISPMNFNQSAFQASAAYQVKGEVAANMKGYREFKKQEAEARKLEKEMEAIYAGLAKQNIKSNRSDDSIMDSNTGDYALTFEGKRKVLGGNGSGTPDGLAPYAIAATDFLLGDIATMIGPGSTTNERITAAAFTFIKPIKVLDKGHDVLKGVKIKDAGKGIDNAKDINKLNVDDIPTAKSGNFNKFFNSLTSNELDELWKDKKIRKKIERQLREPGGLHEWHLVSRAPQFKCWNIGAEEIKDLRTAISDVKFVNPKGVHGGLGSTKAHNELLAIIDTSSDYNTFVRRLNNWANYRLEGGVSSLPQGLRLK